MNTVKNIEQADDRQLRALVREFQWHQDYRVMIQSELPLLTVERGLLLNLLRVNSIFQFIH